MFDFDGPSEEVKDRLMCAINSAGDMYTFYAESIINQVIQELEAQITSCTQDTAFQNTESKHGLESSQLKLSYHSAALT